MNRRLSLNLLGFLAISFSCLVGCGDDAGTTDAGMDSSTMDGGTDGGTDGGDLCASAGCDANASCSSDTGTAVCTCNEGFVGDGLSCEEAMFCTAGICGAGSCIEGSDGYTCDCPAGFEDDGTTCADVDECAADATLCGDGTCVNTDGAYTCTCPDGFEDDGTTCVDIDECAGDACGVGECTNTEGSFMCVCPEGSLEEDDTCVDIDECEDEDICGMGECVNVDLSYTCTCPEGFEDDGTTCVDIDECTDEAICGAGTCMNTEGSYTCDCPEGTTDDGTTCVDIDECTEDPTVCGAGTCMNLDPGYDCTCPDGFNDDGTTCVDIDECGEGTDTCSDREACLNTEGSFTCECLPGFSGREGACERGLILAYTDNDDAETAIRAAADTLGHDLSLFRSRPAFQTAFDAGGYDLVIYDTPGSGVNAADETRLTSWLDDGGRLIFAAFNLNSFAGMASALGVSATTFNSPRPIHRANDALIDLYDQFDSIDSPITTTADFIDNGDELTLTGEGQILARFDSATGPGAIARTLDGRVVVNGFLSADIADADGDTDMTVDLIELYRNQINLVMNPIVLTWTRDTEGGASGATAKRIQWTSVSTRDEDVFAEVYDAGIADLVAIDESNSDLESEVVVRLNTDVPSDARVVFNYWNLDESVELQTTLEVSTESFGMPRSVVPEASAPANLFSFYQDVPNPLAPEGTRFADNGDELMTTADDGFIAGVFDDADGPGAIAVVHDGRVVVNGFLVGNYEGDNNDSDLRLDIEELIENEMYFVLLAD